MCEFKMDSFCSHIVLVPVPPDAAWSHKSFNCVYFFSGVRSIFSHRKHVPCLVSRLDVRARDEAVSRLGNRITLPLVDTYFHLGYKILYMLQWAVSNTNATKFLYLDKDTLDGETHSSLKRKFAAVPEREVLVGDIMDCLTPSNQVCCCHDFYYAARYNLLSPYERSPSIVWGGAGTGMHRSALERMMNYQPYVHIAGDHTLSMWAHQSGIPFRQAPWSSKASRWCSSGFLNVTRVNIASWRCRSSTVNVLRLDVPSIRRCGAKLSARGPEEGLYGDVRLGVHLHVGDDGGDGGGGGR